MLVSTLALVVLAALHPGTGRRARYPLRGMPALAPQTPPSAPTMAEPPPAGDPAATSADAPADDDEVESLGDSEVVPVSPRAAWFGPGAPQLERVLDHYTARVSRAHTFTTLIAHRNRAGILEAPGRDLVGFDSGGLKVGLGLRYGVADRVDFGVYRMNGTYERYDTYEFDARVQLFRQDEHLLDLALRTGYSVFVDPDRPAASGYFMQLIADRLAFERWLLGGGIIYHSSSSSAYKGKQDAGSTTAFYAFSELRLLDWLAADIEVTVPMAGYAQNFPAIVLGPRILTNRHTFALVVANTQFFSTDSIITGSDKIQGRSAWLLGFHITREI